MKPRQVSIEFPNDPQAAEVVIGFNDLPVALAKLKAEGRHVLAMDTDRKRGNSILHAAPQPAPKSPEPITP